MKNIFGKNITLLAFVISIVSNSFSNIAVKIYSFEEALAETDWCSSDPVCYENAHELKHSYNLAACHACLFLSETSCELSNRYLDRKVLTDQNIGFWPR